MFRSKHKTRIRNSILSISNDNASLNLATFPPEVLLLIFSFMDFKTLNSVAGVSHLFCRIAVTPSLWQVFVNQSSLTHGQLMLAQRRMSGNSLTFECPSIEERLARLKEVEKTLQPSKFYGSISAYLEEKLKTKKLSFLFASTILEAKEFISSTQFEDLINLLTCIASGNDHSLYKTFLMILKNYGIQAPIFQNSRCFLQLQNFMGSNPLSEHLGSVAEALIFYKFMQSPDIELILKIMLDLLSPAWNGVWQEHIRRSHMQDSHAVILIKLTEQELERCGDFISPQMGKK